MTATRTVLGTCHHDCPDSCGWVVTVEDTETGPRAVKLRGNNAHPYSQGELCPKVNRFLDRVYSPDRILQPLRRTGPKGSGQFESTTWASALEEIARRMNAAIGAHGPETVMPYYDAGNQSVLAMNFANRFLTKLGATRLVGSVCGQTVRAGVAATNGTGKGIDPMDIRHSQLILLWGTNTKLTNRHLWPFIEQARGRGARVIVIDPIRTATADAADWFIQLRPGTDAALALAVMHILVRDDLVDHQYIEQHTVGFDALAVRVKEWPPERASEVCGLGVDDIERLAQMYGTIRPSVIRTLVGAEHREHGAMLHRTIACLPALVGAWRDRGGGFCRSTGVWFGDAVAGDLVGRFDTGGGATARRAVNMNHLARALTDESLDPPITVLLAWNGNPLVSQPNTELMRTGLLRDDLFTIVHEQFLTDTARYADIVLPATTQIEAPDVVTAWGHLYIGANEQAIEPLGESVSNTELFRRLALAMGYTEPALFEADDALMEQALAPLGPDARAALHRDGFVRLDLPDDLRPLAPGESTDRIQLYSETLERKGHDPLPTYQPAAESPGGDPALTARHPLVLLTTKSHTRFLNTSYTHLPKHGPLEGAPYVEIDPADATARTISDGDTVRIWNDRGALTLTARISDRVQPGVVSTPFGWWMKDCGGQVANSLTNDNLSDWGGGVAFHDTLVEVARTD
jgi:anaerobic selenocysteine-containing dehydrogenase